MPRDDGQCHDMTNHPKPNNIINNNNNNNNKSLLLSFILKPLVMCLLTSLFFLFLGLAALLLVLLLGAASLHRRHHRCIRLRRRPAVRRLSQFRFSPTSPQAGGDCVVCLEEFSPGQWCRALGGCGHVFHRRCVDAWLIKVPACPMCRTRVGLDYGDGACGGSGRGLEDEDKWLWVSRVS